MVIMITPGMTVRHRQRSGKSYGLCEVISVNSAARTAKVRWLSRTSATGMNPTDVNLDCLHLLS